MPSQAAAHARRIRRAVQAAVRCAQTKGRRHTCDGPASHYAQPQADLADSATGLIPPPNRRSPDTTYLLEDGSVLVLTDNGVTPPTCTTLPKRWRPLHQQSHVPNTPEPDTSQQAHPDGSLSLNTRRAYAAAWHSFEKWCRQTGTSTASSDPAQIAAYLQHTSDNGASLATVKLQRAAIKSLLDSNGRHRDNPASQPIMKQLLRSIAQQQGRAQKQAHPLDHTAMTAIRATAHGPRRLPSGRTESFETAHRRGTTDVALASLMREALLRISETSALTWNDLTVLPDGSARLLIRTSKTDQEVQGKSLYIGPQATQDVMSLWGNEHPSENIFSLTPGQITHRLKQACRHAGINGNISGHSPRVGMAQDLSANGAELPALMTAGRWSSPAMPARYIENITADRGAVAQYNNRPRSAPDSRRG